MMLRLYVKKIGETFDVGEFDSLPEISQQYLIQYGVDQSGTDSHASVVVKDWKGTPDELKAAVRTEVQGWIDKLRNGMVRVKLAEDPKVTARRELEKLGFTQAQIDGIMAGQLPEATKRRSAA